MITIYALSYSIFEQNANITFRISRIGVNRPTFYKQNWKLARYQEIFQEQEKQQNELLMSL